AGGRRGPFAEQRASKRQRGQPLAHPRRPLEAVSVMDLAGAERLLERLYGGLLAQNSGKRHGRRRGTQHARGGPLVVGFRPLEPWLASRSLRSLAPSSPSSRPICPISRAIACAWTPTKLRR